MDGSREQLGWGDETPRVKKANRSLTVSGEELTISLLIFRAQNIRIGILELWLQS
jgi:hypothetical protein